MSTITLNIESTSDALQERCDDLATLVQDMTAIIAAKCEQERTLSEQIAQAIGPMLDTDPSDMELPELVGALIDCALGEHARAQVMSMEPEDAPGVFLVLNESGRHIGPFHYTAREAQAWVSKQFGHDGYEFAVVRRVATTSLSIKWKED